MNAPLAVSSLVETVETGTSWRALLARERGFLVFIGVSMLACGVCYPHPEVARWLAFALAAYAVVGNDSIQTIGTFIASNRERPWWALWLWIAGLFVVTVCASWLIYDGDVTWTRLSHKGFHETPRSFSFLHVAAPVFLLILTRLRMPVSTTFLILSAFATDAGAMKSVLQKSFVGYGVALAVAFMVWFALAPRLAAWWKGEPDHRWVVAQWLTSGTLWAFWIMQDAANVAVFLPRKLAPVELLVFVGTICAGLAMMLYLKGERIQEIVDRKSDVVDVRSATSIDFVYAIVVGFFTFYAKSVPMSTTWVFVGLLGGRELALSLRRVSGRPWRAAVAMMGWDLLLTTTGLVVSVAIALGCNPAIRDYVAALAGM